ncbi:MAG TPA: cytochrome b N-terminal domain-containing protein [Fimbriimonadaceae bacterium]|nr:cytochrome b N-terminal domain-containing protein [Fimbriimonadaceae bacterium]HRJ97107.1 cytochrome b N-terminal domain-containing protein [Fimbriimonadaceae bacterium]
MTRGERLAPLSVAILLVLAAALFISGWLLSIPYEPSRDGAYRSVAAIYQSGFWGLLARFHEFGSGALILLSFAAVALMILTQSFREDRWLWYSAVSLLLAAMGFQLTGHLLPFDRHAVQTAAIEGAIAGRMPLIGPDAQALLLRGDAVGQPTLDFWYLAHRWLLPLLLFASMFVGWVGLRRSEGSPGRIVPLLPTLAIFALSFFLTPTFGSPALEADAATFETRPNWYTWPLHGMLVFSDRLGMGWVGVALVPGLFVAFLIAVPLLSKRYTATLIQMVFGAFVAAFAVAALGAGRPAPLLGNQDPPVIAVAEPNERLPIDPTLVASGRLLFIEKGCGGCHTIEGRRANGGPPLDGVWQRHTDPDWYRRFIRKPSSVKPASTMPEFPGLGDSELRALAEFLRKPRPIKS